MRCKRERPTRWRRVVVVGGGPDRQVSVGARHIQRSPVLEYLQRPAENPVCDAQRVPVGKHAGVVRGNERHRQGCGIAQQVDIRDGRVVDHVRDAVAAHGLDQDPFQRRDALLDELGISECATTLEQPTRRERIHVRGCVADHA